MRTIDEKVIVALHEIRDAIGGGGEGSVVSSKETTIDDVVNFIKEVINNAKMFPYSTFEEIPVWNGNQGTGVYRKGSATIPRTNTSMILNIPPESDYIVFYYFTQAEG